ncbi:MAG: ABC transporter permease [Alphaproteobacteria bacterium]
MSEKAAAVSIRIGSIFVLIILWYFAAILMADAEVLPGPLAIAYAIVGVITEPGPEGRSAFFHVGITLGRTFITFGVAMALGIAIGLAMGLRKTIEYSMMSLIPLALTMPTILMVFLAVMWFGFNEIGSLVAVVGVVTPYVAVNIFQGAQAMDKSVIDMATVFRADKKMMIRKVYIPQLLPYIFSAFRFAFGMTWKIVALAETFGIKYGIGYMFFFWFEQFNMELVLAWIIMFVILMLALEHGVFARLEHAAFKWRPANKLQT